MKKTLAVSAVLGLLALLAVAALSAACTKADADDGDQVKTINAESSAPVKVINAESSTTSTVGDPYPLSTCPVSGEKLGGMGDPVIYNYNGREIRFCCHNCVKKFEANPDKYIKQIDADIVKQQKPYYPLDTCVVTGEKLGEDEPVVDFVYNNRLFELCCNDCPKKLVKDPAKYFKELDAAVVDAQLADYPLTTCPVTGEKLGGMGDPVDFVFADRLVRFCCSGCIKKFKADPLKYMAEVDAAENS